MNPFERFGIKSLSPTGLLTYQAQPALWLGKQLFGWRDEASPKAWCGNAVETGLHSRMHKAADFLERAYHIFDQKAQGEVSNDIEQARANIKPMIEQAWTAYADRHSWEVPLYQVRCETWIDGIEVPLCGWLDFEWPEEIDDLKTTLACPTKARDDHVVQMGAYLRARNKQAGRLIYCTPKRFNIIPVTRPEADAAFDTLVRAARAVRHLLSRVRDREDAIRLFAPDLSDYRWNDQTKKLVLEALA